jgi:uncharacterized membrane protein (UPF0182 family)
MRTSIPRMSRRGRITVLAVVVVLALLLFLSWLVNAWTDWLWFSEVHYTAVFTTVLWTRVGMFLVFGVAMGAFLALNL